MVELLLWDKNIGDNPLKASLAMMDVMDVEGGFADTEIDRDSAWMKLESKESRNDNTLSVFARSLLLGCIGDIGNSAFYGKFISMTSHTSDTPLLT